MNCTLVEARTLLHRRVPQPHGGNLFRCATEAPGRVAGSVVPMSTITYELDGGRLWPYVADWEAVSAAVSSFGTGGRL